MPGPFAPIERDGKLLVDGGLVNPALVSMCRALGAEIVIAVERMLPMINRVMGG